MVPCWQRNLLSQAIVLIILADLGKGPLGSRQGQALPCSWHLRQWRFIGSDGIAELLKTLGAPTVVDGVDGVA
jgi:hypothetical protein